MCRLSAARVVSEKRKFSDFDSADSSFNNKKTAAQQHRRSVKLRFSGDHHAKLEDRPDHYRYTVSSKLVPQETTTTKSFDDSKNLRAEKLKIRFAVTINKAREAMHLPPMKLDAQETEICTKPTCEPRKRQRQAPAWMKLDAQETEISTRPACDPRKRERQAPPLMKLDAQETEIGTKPTCGPRKRQAPPRMSVKPMKTTFDRADVSKSSMQLRRGHTSLKLASQETDTRKSCRKADDDTNTQVKLAKQEIITKRVCQKEDIERERQAAREKIEAMETVDFADNLSAMFEMDKLLGRSWRQFQYHSAARYVTTGGSIKVCSVDS